MKSAIAVAFALLLLPAATPAKIASSALMAGDTFEIRKEYETSEKMGDETSGSSSGHATIMERVIEVRDDGLVLEYDLRSDTKREDRDRQWQFPARLFKAHSAKLQLLNRVELEARLKDWLKKAKLTQAACGRWTFTWNAFKIECNPETVIELVKEYDLGPRNLFANSSYKHTHAAQPGMLKQTAIGAAGVSYSVEMPLDPSKVRQDFAEADVIVGEILGKPITIGQALLAQTSKQITGTIRLTFETLPSGDVQKRTTVTEMEIRNQNGKTETRMAKEIVMRRLIARKN